MDPALPLQSTSTSSGGGAALAVVGVVFVAFLVFELVAGWKLLVKAGQPGWGILIPFYNTLLILGSSAGRGGGSSCCSSRS
jgi:hypothetical protein